VGDGSAIGEKFLHLGLQVLGIGIVDLDVLAMNGGEVFSGLLSLLGGFADLNVSLLLLPKLIDGRDAKNPVAHFFHAQTLLPQNIIQDMVPGDLFQLQGDRSANTLVHYQIEIAHLGKQSQDMGNLSLLNIYGNGLSGILLLHPGDYQAVSQGVLELGNGLVALRWGLCRLRLLALPFILSF
jgi:hypothetical protein